MCAKFETMFYAVVYFNKIVKLNIGYYFTNVLNRNIYIYSENNWHNKE